MLRVRIKKGGCGNAAKINMKDLFLGNKKVSACMVGTWAWGTGMNGSKMVFGRKYDKEILRETFNLAVDKGFTFWDTAEVYGMGNSEKLLGEFMRGKNNVVLSTKHFPATKFKEGSMEKSLSDSVARLGISQPYIYWLHNANSYKENIQEIIKLKKAGKVNCIGVSNFTFSQIKDVSKTLEQAGMKIDAVQNHFSLLHYTPEQKNIVKWCNDNGVVYFSYMVLEQGALSGKYDANHRFPFLSNRNFVFGKSKFIQIAPLIELIKKLSAKYHIDSSQIPIIWAISKGTVPIVGLTKPEHVKKLSEGVKTKLSNEDINLLEITAQKTNVVINCSWEPKN